MSNTKVAVIRDTTLNEVKHHGNVDTKAQRDSEDVLYQDVVTQFPFLNGYTHLSFIFHPDTSHSQDVIVANITDALNKLVLRVPWLAGQMLHTPGPPGSSGYYALAPWPSDGSKNVIVRVKDCTRIMPPMAHIVQAGVPISMLDGKILTPFPGLALPHGLEPPLPVMVLQINFLLGGVILNVAAHHMILDGTAIVQIMRLLATILKGHDISASDIEQANRDRRRVVPLIPSNEPVKDHRNQLRALPGYLLVPPSSPPKWCYFKIPVSALSKLVKSASSSQHQLSENDIISAFCWQRITSARLARGFPPDTITKLVRIIDARAAVGVPITYLGHLTYYSITQLPMRQVTLLPLSAIARILRRELNMANNSWAIRSFATCLAREPDKSRLVYAGARNFDTDLGMTAFTAGQSGRQQAGSAIPDTFGPVLGPLEYIRRPNGSPLIGGITICPIEKGEIPIAMCLPEIDLEGLSKDAEWFLYSRYIG